MRVRLKESIFLTIAFSQMEMADKTDQNQIGAFKKRKIRSDDRAKKIRLMIYACYRLLLPIKGLNR